MFSSFSMASLALPGMSDFVVELVVFFGLITDPKFMLMPKMLINFVMAIRSPTLSFLCFYFLHFSYEKNLFQTEPKGIFSCNCSPKRPFSPFKHRVNATRWYAISV
jgi:NADH:ubiquinone oxidoreductase subunit 4 (subunit M)